ncbi:MAG TPA: hypothetical protein VGB59_12500 [Allosphingosinicella sp.]|jgi:hypothetical protein
MKLLFAAAAIAAAAPLAAQAPAAAPADPKISQVIVYGNDACPPSTDDTIVVCAKKPEGERYRIPENLRGNPNDPKNESWATKATELQYVGRSGIGSCSPAGPGGMIGCYNDLVRQARAERATRDGVNWNRLIEDARQERLGRIDAEAEATEAEVRAEEANRPR